MDSTLTKTTKPQPPLAVRVWIWFSAALLACAVVHLFFGFMVVPKALCIAYPDAPLSRLFRWCFRHFGQDTFLVTYAGVMLLLTVVGLFPFGRHSKHIRNA